MVSVVPYANQSTLYDGDNHLTLNLTQLELFAVGTNFKQSVEILVHVILENSRCADVVADP